MIINSLHASPCCKLVVALCYVVNCLRLFIKHFCSHSLDLIASIAKEIMKRDMALSNTLGLLLLDLPAHFQTHQTLKGSSCVEFASIWPATLLSCSLHSITDRATENPTKLQNHTVKPPSPPTHLVESCAAPCFPPRWWRSR